LKAYAGDYLIEGPNVAATFRAEGGRLTISINDEVAQPLLALNDSTFMLPVWNATLTFHRDTDGFYSRASLDRGEVFALQRIDPWTPTPKDLALYAGRYFSEEIETVYMLAVEDETLVLKHRSVGSVVLRSQKRDTFESASPLLQVRFVRDDNSSIASFSISNGRTQGVRFEKLN
jgi:hypothetical protein